MRRPDRVLRQAVRARRIIVAAVPAQVRAGAGPTRVVVVCAVGRRRDAAPWLRPFRDAETHLMARGGTPPTERWARGTRYHRVLDDADAGTALRAVGAVDVIIDLRPRAQRPASATWHALGPHLRRGGTYVIGRATGADLDVPWNGSVEPNDSGAPPTQDHDVRQVAGALVVTKTVEHLVLLTDAETMALLTAREPAVSLDVVQSLPAGTLTSPGVVRLHGLAGNIRGFATRMDYPAMRVRHYRGPFVFAGNTLLYSGHSLVSDSSRFYRAARMSHPYLTAAGPGLARMPAGPSPSPLPGSYYLLDPQFTAHFGHILTEVVPRLWGWDQAKADLPELKVLYRASPEQPRDEVISTLLSAYGIDDADQVAVHEPVTVTSVLCASALWHGSNAPPHFVHPRVVDVWERIAGTLVGADAQGPQRVFVARPAGSRLRHCRNADEVEALFVAHGFTVVRPEELELRAQAEVFREARVIAGYAGSGMFNAMYAHRLERMIVLAHTGYLARHENKFAAARGADLDYFWSPPDVEDPGHHNPFYASWEFDFGTHLPSLEKLLGDL